MDEPKLTPGDLVQTTEPPGVPGYNPEHLDHDDPRRHVGKFGYVSYHIKQNSSWKHSHTYFVTLGDGNELWWREEALRKVTEEDVKREFLELLDDT